MGNWVYYLTKRITTGTFYSHNSGCFLKVLHTDYSINTHLTLLLLGMVLYGACTNSFHSCFWFSLRVSLQRCWHCISLLILKLGDWRLHEMSSLPSLRQLLEHNGESANQAAPIVWCLYQPSHLPCRWASELLLLCSKGVQLQKFTCHPVIRNTENFPK